MFGENSPKGDSPSIPFAVDYYDHFWETSRENSKESEIDRAKRIISILPEGMESVLEVGCGDGLIINRVAVEDRTGTDLSKEGLISVNCPSVICPACDMPFPDRRWDIVIASEVLEHILEEEYEKSLSEVARVANRYILISVPNRENLKQIQAKCPICNSVFHPSIHLRSFKRGDLDGLFPGFRVDKVLLIGPKRRIMTTLEIFIRYRVLKRWAHFVDYQCPICGSSWPGSSRANDKRDTENKVFAVLKKGTLWLLGLYRRENWLCALFIRENDHNIGSGG